MVGIDRKNENSRAAARDIRATCPAAIVDIDRDVPGKTADNIWQAPIQMAWVKLMSSILQVFMRPPPPGPAASDFEFQASTSHITIPPTSSEVPMMYKLSKCLPMILVSRNAGMAVTTKATMVRPKGCVRAVLSPRSPAGKVEMNLAIRLRK